MRLVFAGVLRLGTSRAPGERRQWQNPACRRGVWSYSFSSHENAFGQGENRRTCRLGNDFGLDDWVKVALNLCIMKTVLLILGAFFITATAWSVDTNKIITLNLPTSLGFNVKGLS
jgi:hypothetical protein